MSQPVPPAPPGTRPPRVRPQVGRTREHPTVPGNHIFSARPVRLGTGLNSGRNMLVLKDNETEPITRVPLIIERGRTDRPNVGGYTMPDQFLPAGLSLTQVVHSYPRHAWGSMLRVYMAEGWTAERMWNHLPHDFRRNQGAQRPWNYIQAAMGREVDKMFEEETGRKRVPIPRPRVPSVAAENPSEDDDDPSEGEEDQSEDEENPNEDESGTETNPPPRPLKTHADLTLDQLKKIAYIADHKVNEIEQRIIALKPEATQEYRSIWKKAQDEWYQAQMDAYKRDTGRDLRHSRKPNLVLREVWKTGYPRSDDEGLAEYHARADWNAWYKLTKQFQDLEKARRAQLQQMQLELANATTARIDG